jgi:hypothetical protein
VLNPVTIKISELRSVTVSPNETIDYVAQLKLRIKILEEELKDYEPKIIALANQNKGVLKSDWCDITLCKRKEYTFSEDVEKLESQRKKIDAKIKAKQLLEITAGAACTEKPYLRYNVRMP